MSTHTPAKARHLTHTSELAHWPAGDLEGGAAHSVAASLPMGPNPLFGLARQADRDEVERRYPSLAVDADLNAGCMACIPGLIPMPCPAMGECKAEKRGLLCGPRGAPSDCPLRTGPAAGKAKDEEEPT